MAYDEIAHIKEEIMLNRDRYHTLSGETAVIKGRVEMAENELDEVNEMSTAIQVLEEKVSSWMTTTTEYRKSLCTKLDVVMQKLSDLPCKERRGIYDSISKQLSFMWVVLGAITLSLIASGISVIFKH